MLTAGVAQVRRLVLSRRCKINTILNTFSQPSYSVLAAVRSQSQCQVSITPPNMVCNSLFSTTFTSHQSIVTIKTAPDKSSATECPDPAPARNSAVDKEADDSGLTLSHVSESGDSLPSTETSQPACIPPPADSPQSGGDRLPGEPRRSGQLPTQSHGLAPFVAASADLRRLVALGVDVSSWDRRPGIPQLVLRLNWERDVAPRLRFLHDAGVPADRLAAFITRNPLIFRERLEDLQVRLNYLEAKRFSPEQVASVISRGPFWLLFSTTRIDRRLGLFAGLFGLSAPELRQLAARCPGLITSNVRRVKDSVFTIKEEFGFQRQELKRLLLGKPKVLLLARSALQDRLHYLHNEMGLSHELIAEAPNVLTYRSWRVRQRHLMLSMLKRDQYDRSRPGYVSLDRLVGTTDQEFCRDVAQVPVASYNEFLKTL